MNCEQNRYSRHFSDGKICLESFTPAVTTSYSETHVSSKEAAFRELVAGDDSPLRRARGRVQSWASVRAPWQILAVDPVRGEMTIKHEDIKGFMPGMTMPFKVSQPSLMTGIVAGDLVRATLLVEDSRGLLTAVTRTGTAALTEAPPRPYVEPLAPGTEVPDVPLPTTPAPRGILPIGVDA